MGAKWAVRNALVKAHALPTAHSPCPQPIARRGQTFLTSSRAPVSPALPPPASCLRPGRGGQVSQHLEGQRFPRRPEAIAKQLTRDTTAVRIAPHAASRGCDTCNMRGRHVAPPGSSTVSQRGRAPGSSGRVVGAIRPTQVATDPGSCPRCAERAGRGAVGRRSRLACRLANGLAPAPLPLSW